MEDEEMNTMLSKEEVIPTEMVATSRKNVNRYFFILFALFLIATLVYILFTPSGYNAISETLNKDNHLFYWMLLVGFFAELVAGSMGMGYGVICTTILLILNIPPTVISASIHSAEAFTSATGSISHYKLGNINIKLLKKLAISAIIGAIIGALLLSYVGERYAKIIKPFIAVYTLYLGIRILQNAFKGKSANGTIKASDRKKINIPVLGLVGGFIDSFGGGGWGPLVTGTFIRNGRTPRYVIGSSTAAKCMLTVASAVTFIFTIGIQHWNIVAGLLIGGIVTAPFSAMLTAKLPVKKMYIAVGILVIVCSLISFCRTVFL